MILVSSLRRASLNYWTLLSGKRTGLCPRQTFIRQEKIQLIQVSKNLIARCSNAESTWGKSSTVRSRPSRRNNMNKQADSRSIVKTSMKMEAY